MITINFEQLNNVINAQFIVHSHSQLTIESVSTDSRKLGKNALFIALKGEQFDGHDYCQCAMDNGAVALVVMKELPNIILPQFVVADTYQALGQLAAWVKAQLQPITIALTGSCGKTTVKEMTASILSQIAPTLATLGNYNNQIGVPLTLLNLEPQHRYAVIEQGANHLGEIAYTSHLIHAQIVLINNLAAAHLEGFGSLEGVAQAKGEIFYNFDNPAIELSKYAIVNLENNALPLWHKLYEAQLQNVKIQTFAQDNAQADFYGRDIVLDSENRAQFILNSPNGSIEIKLNILGLHNVTNALAAAALSLCAGATLEQIKQGLESVSLVKGRTQAIKINEQITMIDDTYNASVPSMLAAIDLIKRYSGLKLLLLADMAELGAQNDSLHQQVANHIAQLTEQEKIGLTIYSYGHSAELFSQALKTNVAATVAPSLHFTDQITMGNAVKYYLNQNQRKQITILAKGANCMKMSQFIQILQKELQGESK